MEFLELPGNIMTEEAVNIFQSSGDNSSKVVTLNYSLTSLGMETFLKLKFRIRSNQTGVINYLCFHYY